MKNILSWMTHSMATRLAATFLGAFTVAVASFFLMGYIFHKPDYYTWPSGMTPVALPTAIIFISLGSAIVMLARRHDTVIEQHLSNEDRRLQQIEEAIKALPCNECEQCHARSSQSKTAA